MLHDRVSSSETFGIATLERPQRSPGGRIDRRRGMRVPFPAELLLLWHHDPAHPVSYRIIDAGEGGFRVRAANSSMALEHCMGMTGMALKVLPGDGRIEQAVCVAWVRLREDACSPEGGGEYELGLRYF